VPNYRLSFIPFAPFIVLFATTDAVFVDLLGVMAATIAVTIQMRINATLLHHHRCTAPCLTFDATMVTVFQSGRDATVTPIAEIAQMSTTALHLVWYTAFGQPKNAFFD